MRELASDGQFRGILVHDSRNASIPPPISPSSGVLAQTPARRAPHHVGRHDRTERGAAARSSPCSNSSATCSISTSSPGRRTQTQLETNERYLPELLWPQSGEKLDQRRAQHLLRRSQQPAGGAALLPRLRADRALRRSAQDARRPRRLCPATDGRLRSAQPVLRIAGYGAQGLAARHPVYCTLLLPDAASGRGHRRGRHRRASRCRRCSAVRAPPQEAAA